MECLNKIELIQLLEKELEYFKNSSIDSLSAHY